ncbi:hypothetical protein [Citrobacter koseri]|uniref:hypothetical protein n=1 Tax=Citrobacter koseri TaxID=545 RepID=UPI0023B13411|nr:hypothetical protein [Citrobacter koseri]
MKSTVETKICELVKRGHLLSSEVSDENTEILRSSVAAMLSDLASQLEVQLVRSNALAAENAGLKRAAEFATASDMWEDLGCDVYRYQYIDWYVDGLKAAMETPATDAFLAEVRARSLDEFARAQDEQAKKYYELSPGCSGQNECQFAAGQAWYFAECIRKECSHET